MGQGGGGRGAEEEGGGGEGGGALQAAARALTRDRTRHKRTALENCDKLEENVNFLKFNRRCQIRGCELMMTGGGVQQNGAKPGTKVTQKRFLEKRREKKGRNDESVIKPAEGEGG